MSAYGYTGTPRANIQVVVKRGQRVAGARLSSFPGCLKQRSPFFEKLTVELPYGTDVW